MSDFKSRDSKCLGSGPQVSVSPLTEPNGLWLGEIRSHNATAYWGPGMVLVYGAEILCYLGADDGARLSAIADEWKLRAALLSSAGNGAPNS
jgi:hypothetical protein